MQRERTWRFPATPAYAREARRAVERHAREQAAPDPDAIALAVSEAFTVALDETSAASVEVVASRAPGELHVRIRYPGPRRERVGPDAGSLPFLIIPQLTRRFEIRRTRDGTAELQMTFGL